MSTPQKNDATIDTLTEIIINKSHINGAPRSEIIGSLARELFKLSNEAFEGWWEENMPPSTPENHAVVSHAVAKRTATQELEDAYAETLQRDYQDNPGLFYEHFAEVNGDVELEVEQP